MPPLRIFSLSLSGQREHPSTAARWQVVLISVEDGKITDWVLLVHNHNDTHARFVRTRQVGRIPKDSGAVLPELAGRCCRRALGTTLPSTEISLVHPLTQGSSSLSS
ncbi:unnamed protein product [Vitrella brassicaformis CCMP3155]|uniref:Uncharacterized protein n=1 Tax=Vitrella brassicaformis (strain CCMP3155) TaxID=1169540 RepID=A0A0G4EXA7_VITBC|nr:unnamed protein product [Vitrella brassicaformis CCMP3155]|eukprot:CEM03428.1 unnamed protein product [Vitrella brassicaformis CCMP3155]